MWHVELNHSFRLVSVDGVHAMVIPGHNTVPLPLKVDESPNVFPFEVPLLAEHELHLIPFAFSLEIDFVFLLHVLSCWQLGVLSLALDCLKTTCFAFLG